MARCERVTARRWRAPTASAVEVLVWTALSWGIWLLSLSAVGTEDLLVGGLSALGCGLAAAAARRALRARWRPSASALWPAARLPLSIVVDTLVVLRAPWRRTNRIRIETVDIGAAGGGSTAAARRAIATIVTSATPASLVLDADPDSGHLVVHKLGPSGPDLPADHRPA